MVNDVVANLVLTEACLRDFFPAFQSYMDDTLNPGFLGVPWVNFVLQLSKESGHDLVCQTSRQLNQASRAHVRDLARGFVAGWSARALQHPTADGR
jgi:hypothetical protein